MIIHQHSFILVGPPHAAIELRTGNARAHRKGRGDPREEHHRTAEYDYRDERKETDDYEYFIEGSTTFAPTTIRAGDCPDTACSRVPHPVSLHTEHCYLRSRRYMSAS
jgi:hypothetical protein